MIFVARGKPSGNEPERWNAFFDWLDWNIGAVFCLVAIGAVAVLALIGMIIFGW